METLLILAAVAVAGLALAYAAILSAQARRPPLRMRREEELANGDEEGLIRSMRPSRTSPIDRDAQVIETERDETRLIDARTIEAEMIEARLIEAKLIGGKAIGDPPEGDAGPAAPRGRDDR